MVRSFVNGLQWVREFTMIAGNDGIIHSHGEPRVGATYVDVTIRNPADPERSWTGKFLVDAGAFDSFVTGRNSNRSDLH